MSESIDLSVIIPAYNESVRLGPSLSRVISYLSQQLLSSEVIVVDDGSTDDTAHIVESFIKDRFIEGVSVRLLLNPTNMGKGFSVRHGVLQAKGKVVAFTDADLSAPITELTKLTDPIRQGQCDVAIGSRAVDRRLIGHRQPPWRDYAGRVFNLLMRLIVGLSFKDTQCGFKAYRREAILPIFQQQRLHGFGFDVEVLYLAKKHGLRAQEVAVVWNHVEGSRVRLFRDSVRMLVDLLKVRWSDATGKYAKVDPQP